MPVGFSKACRTCLTLDGTLISIYDALSYDGKGRVIDVIKDITKITPKKSDGLPELVCQTCFNEINRCYTFKVKCLNSDSTLRKLFVTEEELAGQQQQQQVLAEEGEKECKPIIQNLTTLHGSDQVEPEQEPPPIKIKTEKDCDAFGYFVITSVCGAEDGQTFENFQAPQRYIKEEIDCDGEYYNTSSNRGLNHSEVCQSSQSLYFDNYAQETNYLQVKLEPDEPFELEAHNINAPLKPNIQCPKCGREFLYTSRLKKHMRSHNTRPYVCSVCCRTFKLSGQLRRHIDINHKNIKPFKCEECPRTFSFPSKLKEHLRSHNKGNKYSRNINISSLPQTSVAKKEKDEQTTLIEKQNKSYDYTGQNQYEQKQEPKYEANNKEISSNLEDTFEDKSTIWTNDHQRLTRRSARNIREGMKSPDFSSSQIQAYSTTTESPSNKIKTRQSEKSTHIDYSYDSQDQNPEEKNSPEGTRQYNCPHCTKVFKYISRLNEHVVCHSDARPFDCTNCGKFFKTPGQLTRHLKTSHKITSLSRRKTFSRRRGFKRRNLNKGLFRKKSDPFSDQVDEQRTENINDQENNATNNDQQNEELTEKENPNEQLNGSSNDLPENETKQAVGNKNKINQGDSSMTDLSNQTNKDEENEQSKTLVSECSNQLDKSDILQTTSEMEKETYIEPPRIYHCDQCDKPFHSVSRFCEHMLGHGIDRPFICSLCGKGFKSYSNLNSHIIISHKKLKPFKCNDCQRAFSCKSNLNKHLSTRIWTNSCNEGFAGRQNKKKKVKANKNIAQIKVELVNNKDSIPNDYKEQQKEEEQIVGSNENVENSSINVQEQDEAGLPQESNVPVESESVEVSPDLPDPEEISHPLFDSMLNQTENTNVEQKSKKKLECPVCKKIFVYLSYLKKHLQSHSSERPFSCSICDKSFKYKVSLKHHNAITHAKYKPYKCDKCPQDFVNEYNYRVHRNSHNKKAVKKTKAKRRLAIKKPNDTELLKSASNMQDIVEKRNNDVEYTTCSICLSSIQSVKLTEHMQQYHSTSKSTTSVTDPTIRLDQAETLNTDPTNQLKCPQCGKVFLFASYLKKHMRCHNDERPHVCSNCGKAFKDHWRLRSHIKEKHNSTSKKYTQKKKKKIHSHEKKPFSTIIRDHADEQNHHAKIEEPNKILNYSQEHCSEKDTLQGTKCTEANIETSDPSKSQIKTVSKDEEKPSVSSAQKPQCSLCKKEFPFASQLETHMRTHTGERPFSCPTCEKTFTQRGHLKNHILIYHKKIMPFQCSYCLRGFASGFNMRVHMKTHTNLKLKKEKVSKKTKNISKQADKHGTIGTTQETGTNPQDKIQEQVIQDFEKLELHPLFGTMSNQDESATNEPNNYFECTHCDKTFLFRSEFKEHVQAHNTTTSPITCSICYKTFKMESHLKNHTQMKHTKTKDYKCNECDRVFLTFYILNKHMRSHKGMCKAKVKAKSKLDLKKRLNNLKQTHQPEQLYNDAGLNVTEIEDRNTSEVTAPISTPQEQVQQDILTGRNDLQITCALCSVSVFSKDLTDHMKICLSSQFKSEPVENLQSLGHPLFETLSNQDEQQRSNSKHCLQCKKDFSSVSRLAEHMRTHSEERPFICSACGRGFKQSGHLKSHFMIVHQKILPYKCNECPRVFSSRYNLRVHETTHLVKGSRKKTSSKRRVVVKKSYYKDPPYHAKPINVGSAIQINVRENKRNENETVNKNDSENDTFQNPKENNIAFGGNEEKIRCSLCFVSVHPNNLTKHMQEVHNLPEATLVRVKIEPSDKTEHSEESESFGHHSLETMLNHTETGHSNSPSRLQCPTCDKDFVHLSRLNEHMRSHSDERPFICLVCGKTFKRHGHLMTHIAMCHRKTKPFKCKECPKTFSSSLNLNVHLQSHISKELPTVLPVETNLQNPDNIEPLPNDVPQCSINDETAKETTADVTHECSLCPTVFKSITHLMEHMKVHTSDQPFICSLCGKGFNSDDDLSAHLLLKHNKSKPFQCDQCSRKFRTSTGLNKHLLTHTDDYRQQMRGVMRRNRLNKKHNHDPKNQAEYYLANIPQCHICKKEFTNNWVLKEHMRCHTNEKPFVCPICGHGFNKKYNLKIHIMVHKKIKPFKCDYCPNSFYTNAGRNHHLRTHPHGRNRIEEVDSQNPESLTL